jgi:hypothetical protein
MIGSMPDGVTVFDRRIIHGCIANPADAITLPHWQLKGSASTV